MTEQEKYMKEALKEAQKARQQAEIKYFGEFAYVKQ